MSKTLGFRPATRPVSRARVALVGPAGSGKTPAALDLARELVGEEGRIAVVDTQHRAALMYAEVPGHPEAGGHRFSHLPVTRFDAAALGQAAKAAADDGYGVLVIDSYSAWWDGPGGLLELVTEHGGVVRREGRSSGSSDPGWEQVNTLERQMLRTLLSWPGHVVLTMRAVTEHVVVGTRTVRVGTRPVQGRIVEHTVPVVVDMVGGTGTVAKAGGVRGLEGGVFAASPGVEIAAVLRRELSVGASPVGEVVAALGSPALSYREAMAVRQEIAMRDMRDAVVAHPVTGESVPLGVLAQERCAELRAPAAPAAPAAPVAPAGGGVWPGSQSSRVSWGPAPAQTPAPAPASAPGQASAPGPGGPASPASPPAGERAAHPQQITKLTRHMERLNVTDHGRGEVAELMLGEPVEDWPRGLLHRQAVELLATFPRLRTELDLEEWLGRCRERDAARARAAAEPPQEEHQEPAGAGGCATCPGRVLPRPGRETPEQCAVCRGAGIPLPDPAPEPVADEGPAGDVEVVDPEEWPGRGEESQDPDDEGFPAGEFTGADWVDPGLDEPAEGEPVGERAPAMA
ncbi:AAA family ATPase [Streptomyces sp. ST2-7A]|uniref:AAA family ATPase n=1 Tax=Streptomyces sp. ST2-7A TaxID=2907214 RepID=UPI002278F2D9|nr:AAA family ATPase [Streptomyces sp. ST2-7A]